MASFKNTHTPPFRKQEGGFKDSKAPNRQNGV